MTSPKRLIESGSSLDRALLRAAREDRPSDDLERRIVAAAIGAGVSVSLASSARPSLLARLARPRLLVAFAVTAAAAAHFWPSAARAPVAGIAPSVVAPNLPSVASVSEPPLADEVDGIATITPDALPSVHATAAAPRARASTQIARSTTSPVDPPEPRVVVRGASLEREVELLDVVKRGLKTNASAEAERALDAYDAEFPDGTLRPEAGLLRVRVLLARGDRAGATKLGEQILARSPDGLHSARIRAALAAEGAEPSAPSAPAR